MLSRYLVGGRSDPPFYPTKTKPCIASRRIDIVAISIKADIITPTDYWSLVVDENLIVNHVYCKDCSEGLYFQVAHPVKGGREFRFEFYTERDERKRIETSYYFLTDPGVVLRLIGTTDQSYDLIS